MTKTSINNQLKVKNGFWNCTKMVGGIPVAMVAWDTNPYKVIDRGIFFEDVTNEKTLGKDKLRVRRYKRTYTPIKEFYYKQDLVNYLYKVTKVIKI